jgi:hypothetical protein
MTNEDIKQMIDHRVRSLLRLQWALELRKMQGSNPQITIHIDEGPTIKWYLEDFVNPMFEIGLVHGRALLEFLGLCIDNQELAQRICRKTDDIGIESVTIPGTVRSQEMHLSPY